MNETNNQNNATSITDVIASSGSFDIELIKKLARMEERLLVNAKKSSTRKLAKTNTTKK